MPTDDTRETRPLRRQVDEAILEAREAKAAFRQARARGQPGAAADDLRDAVIRLHSVLEEWADDPGVRDVWADHDLDELERYLSAEVTTSRSGSGMSTRGGETERRPAIAAAGPRQLATWMRGLLDVAKELGFAPETTQRTVHEKGTVTDLKWLLTVRNQNPGLDDLEPPADPDDSEDDEVATDGGVRAIQQPGVENTPHARLAVSEVPTGPTGRIPFRGPFFREIAERKEDGKDAKITVSSANAETGVGKSTCAYYLAHVLDTSTKGFRVAEKATLNVDDFLGLYDTLPRGSAAILDEAEQIDSRRAMSGQNVDAAEKWQTRRVQEICALLTLPKFEVLDPRMRDLVDYRIEVERRGEAVVYKKSHKPFSGDIWWQQIERFDYPKMDFAEGMAQLHDMKNEFINSDGSEERVTAEEIKEREEKLKKQAEKERRYSVVKAYARAGMSSREIASQDDVDISDRRVRRILNENGFDWDGTEWVEDDADAE